MHMGYQALASNLHKKFQKVHRVVPDFCVSARESCSQRKYQLLNYWHCSLISAFRLKKLSGTLRRYKGIWVVCLQEALEAVNEHRVVIDLLNGNVPLELVEVAAVVDPAWHCASRVSIPKVGLVLLCALAECICSFYFCQSIRGLLRFLLLAHFGDCSGSILSHSGGW